jgi:hypothetical protein
MLEMLKEHDVSSFSLQVDILWAMGKRSAQA